ncbi:mechanosensitive ion channel domain-containing protein [Catenovulum maritimum]|uniref:Small-conductance mechanosensitive channel n=1 Tax=Catenovulum maritimum TaxID=1513271 RepID=A0A0J8GSG7_9ALTE|nr:mechanosensitive ion channel family protein [Catenovulum maritimum]KMT63653.1 small-conductance mechanosensitive channel [Catenovulum maritimum]
MQELLLSIVIFGLTWFAINASETLIAKTGLEKSISEARVSSVKRVCRLVLGLGGLIAFTFMLGIDYSHIFIFLSSALAVLGVAFFAQWSILSNVTASIIVYFFFPYRVGDDVKVVDGENSIQGKIKEISLFHVILSDDSSQIITYPNSMVFQKAVIITASRNAVKTELDENQVKIENEQ